MHFGRNIATYHNFAWCFVMHFPFLYLHNLHMPRWCCCCYHHYLGDSSSRLWDAMFSLIFYFIYLLYFIFCSQQQRRPTFLERNPRLWREKRKSTTTTTTGKFTQHSSFWKIFDSTLSFHSSRLPFLKKPFALLHLHLTFQWAVYVSINFLFSLSHLFSRHFKILPLKNSFFWDAEEKCFPHQFVSHGVKRIAPSNSGTRGGHTHFWWSWSLSRSIRSKCTGSFDHSQHMAI